MTRSDMDFSEYQHKARETAIYPGAGEMPGLTYAVLGLSNEAGEVAGKLKKVLRDDEGTISQARWDDLVDELGDVMWYLAQVATELAIPLGTVARMNLKKLGDRAERGVLGGSGDKR